MSPQKPDWVGPRYGVIDPALPSDEWDDSEPSNAEELDQQLAKQASKEQSKVAISQSRIRTIPRVLALCVPVALSFAILQLSWRHVYWRDSNEDSHAISEDLAVLQIAAKAHEILIVLSLSHIVLHYVRHQVSSARGLPFGLFTSAYQAAMGSQPISFGLFHALKYSLWRRSVQWRYLSIALSLLFFTILGFAAGPSSAIALIPRLNWWPDDDLFSFYTSIDKYRKEHSSPFTILPGSYCTDESLDVNASCPFAGFQYLLPTLNFTAIIDNTTLDSPLRRVMTTETSQTSTWTSYTKSSTWTTSHVLANYMSLLPTSFYTDSGNLNPSTIETITHQNSTITPLVRVLCATKSAALSVRNLSELAPPFPSDPAYEEVPSPTGEFDITTIWNTTSLVKSNDTMVAFAESPPHTNVSGLLAFIYSPGVDLKPANISMCLATGTWEPSRMWALINGQTGTILSDFTWTGHDFREKDAYANALHDDRPLDRSKQFTIRKAWADALNPVSKNSTRPILAGFVQDGEEVARKQGEVEQSKIHSNILSKAIADGVSRIGAEYRVSPLLPSQRNITICRQKWCFQGPYLSPAVKLSIINGTYDEGRDISGELEKGVYDWDQRMLKTFRQPDDVATAWTRVSFPIKRYGYAWSFQTVTVKVATAILMLHTLVIVMHCIHLLCTGRSYNFASSLGDLIALALNSQPPAALEATSVAIGKGASWARSTAVRESRGGEKDGFSGLEIVADHGVVKGEDHGRLNRRVNVGQRYR